MVYVFLVDGYEDTEMIAPLDMLSRAGIETVRVGLAGKSVTSKLGIVSDADITADEVSFTDDCEMVFLPGGPGTKHYFEHDIVKDAIEFCVKNDRYLAAICAAPSVLSANGVLKGKRATCHFSVNEKMDCAELVKAQVVVDGKIVTGNGAGASVEFGLTLCELLRGKEITDGIRHGIGCDV